MRIALIYPPVCDPTAPYISVPALAAVLRRAGHEVLTVDANLGACRHVLRRPHLEQCAARVERDLEGLEKRPSLNHVEQLRYARLWSSRGDAAWAPARIEEAVDLLSGRGRESFYDRAAYQRAVDTVESALRLIGARHDQLRIDLRSYRTPFSLLTPDEVRQDAQGDSNPFHAYFSELAVSVAAHRAELIGLSVAFTGQVQCAFSLAYALRAAIPGAHLTAGGPALTQLLLGAGENRRGTLIRPFDTAVLFEGEKALLDLARCVETGERPSGVIAGRRVMDLDELPPPDFSTLPLDAYLSPKLVLPYDASRGCYWARCAFCHYGLSEKGPAPYRERSVDTVTAHIRLLRDAHGCGMFHFSQDSMRPGFAAEVAAALARKRVRVKWGSDIRPEPALTASVCSALARGGMLSAAVGVESGAPAVLRRMRKGLKVGDMSGAIANLAAAGIAVEVMVFTGFPGETMDQALATVRFLHAHHDDVSLFMCGEFDLVRGASVARQPERYGVAEVFTVAGDEYATGLFFVERVSSKTPAERAGVDEAVARAAKRYSMNGYPWAGSLSTAHTLLYYAASGPGVFKGPPPPRARPSWRRGRAVFDVARVAAQSRENEERLWADLVFERREVSRAVYDELAARLPYARRSPGDWRYRAGSEPERVPAIRRARTPK